jgi:hypothetical protein
MNPIELNVSFIDGTEETVTCIAPDFVAFEMKFDLSVARLEKEVRITHLFFMAWHSLKRAGKTKDEFEKWMNSVAGVEMGDSKK